MSTVRSVLVCGATGFVGRRIVRTLRDAGLSVTEGSSATQDFVRDTDPARWLPRVSGVDAVINAVGVLRDTATRPLAPVHHQVPAALFEACAQAGVPRVLQISANGVADSDTRYATTKRAADEVLQRLTAAGRLDGTVLRPSIVFGRGGASSALFMSLARLPVLVLPAAAVQARVQPVAVQDVALACLRLLQRGGPSQVTAVGSSALPLADFIGALRGQLGHRPARVIPLPEAPSRWSARVGDRLPFQPWSSESLALLRQDNIGDAGAFAELLSRAPTPLDRFVEASWRSA